MKFKLNNKKNNLFENSTGIESSTSCISNINNYSNIEQNNSHYYSSPTYGSSSSSSSISSKSSSKSSTPNNQKYYKNLIINNDRKSYEKKINFAIISTLID